ncbi:MAG: DUF2339 domain-containing protein [Gammaproteobacteria bacterium]|nr:DUF2339 domain-containing protein [Gammaproteobacteria bacterium]
MYIIFLGIVGFLVLISFFDRGIASLAMLGIVVLLGLLIKKLRQLTNKVGTLESEVGLLVARSSAEKTAAHTDAAEDRQAVQRPATSTANLSEPGETSPQPATSSADSNEVEIELEKPVRPPSLEVDVKTGPVAVPEGTSNAIPDMPAKVAAKAMTNAPVTRRPARASATVPGSEQVKPGPAPASKASRHNWFDRLLTKGTAAAWAWITGGNIFVRVGILILFMGMTFLIRYAIGQNMVPIELRLAIVGVVAIALLVWGWRQRNRKANFALVVQGGGIGLLYLTIFASFSLYRVLDSTMAFVMLGIIVILAAIMAVKQDAKSLALFAAAGGFLAPILTSSGSNNYVGLFSYYTLLNLGIFTVAWFKSWRILNLTGFVFTFAISGVWGVLSYQPEFYSSTQPFLIIFFLLYVGISILFALRRSVNFRDTIDSSLIFGTPLLAFGMQCELVGNLEYGIATSAFALAAFYLVSSFVLWKSFSTRLSLLCETFVSLAVIFATLAIPFAIDGSLTGSIWAIEGAGILWVSIRQQQFYRRLFAVLLMLAAGAITGWEIIFSNQILFLDKSAFANSAFIATGLIAVSAAIGSWLLSWSYDGKRRIETTIEFGLLAYSTVVLLAGFGVQILAFDLFHAHGHLLALLAVVTGTLYRLCAEKLKWKLANWMALGYFALLIPAAFLSFSHQLRLSENYGYLLWPIALIALFHGLKITRVVLLELFSVVIHLVAAVLLALLLFWEGIWQLLLGFSLLSIVFCKFSERYDWRELRLCSILFLPVLVICFISAVGYDGNLITLSSIGSEYYPPLQPGGMLWPLAFATYFYLLLKNPGIGGRFQVYFYLGGALLIAIMLLWLGLWTLLLGATILCWLAYYLARQYQWAEMRLLSKLLFPLMIVVPIVGLANGVVDPVRLIPLNLDFQLTPRSGFFLWPLAFVTLYLMFWLSEKEKQPARELTHALSCLFLVGMATWEISRLGIALVPFSNAWHLVLLPIVGIFAIKSILQAKRWPFNRYREGFDPYTLMPLAAGTVLWSLLQFTSSGKDNPLVWVPLLNPLDAMQCLILYGWITQGRDKLNAWFGLSARHAGFILAGFAFLWINVEIFRFVHHWAGVSWDFSRLIQADLTQTLMSLVWALLGLAGTFLAAGKKHRQVWIISAVLLAVVVLKLFVIDLSAQDTIERIVSFTGVGLLLTFVGYFSPIPPKSNPTDAESEAGAA